eukprot:CAMPEP_0194348188 /NCGR_PEP_ID=MMETSP0171-20130528/106402_1 /TAXON_ID=218684 /ORGANISM="Corethron pennatum, Strain L29A3" /LENGTH=214 /DNA_ID=CAMNT_0039115509 /DNA_START=116 /DNA_END=760 /DNA_ORIENTATION=-
MGRFGVHGFEDFCRSEISDKAAGGLQQSENLLPIAQSFNTPRPRGNSISSAQSSSSPSLCIIQSAAPSLPSVPQSSKRCSSKNDQVSTLSPQLSSSPSVCTIQSAAPSPPSVPQSSKRRSSKYDQIHNSLGRLGVHGFLFHNHQSVVPQSTTRSIIAWAVLACMGYRLGTTLPTGGLDAGLGLGVRNIILIFIAVVEGASKGQLKKPTEKSTAG